MSNAFIKLKFQEGNRKEHGKNGATMEEVVDILLRRIKRSHRGLYKNQDSERALLYLEEAKNALQARGRVYDD